MTWTEVQESAAVNSGTAGTTTPTLPGASAAGNLLIACLMSVSGSTAFTGPAGWSQVIAIANGTANRTEIWYNPNNAGGISSAAFVSGTGTVKGALAEFHSSVGTAVTVEATGTGTSSAALTCTATATGANSAGDLGVTSWGWKVTTATTCTFTPPTGYTDLANNGSVSANAKLDCSWNLSVGAGTAAPQEATSVAPTTFTGVVALFLETPAVVAAVRSQYRSLGSMREATPIRAARHAFVVPSIAAPAAIIRPSVRLRVPPAALRPARHPQLPLVPPVAVAPTVTPRTSRIPVRPGTPRQVRAQGIPVPVPLDRVNTRNIRYPQGSPRAARRLVIPVRVAVPPAIPSRIRLPGFRLRKPVTQNVSQLQVSGPQPLPGPPTRVRWLGIRPPRRVTQNTSQLRTSGPPPAYGRPAPRVARGALSRSVRAMLGPRTPVPPVQPRPPVRPAAPRLVRVARLVPPVVAAPLAVLPPASRAALARVAALRPRRVGQAPIAVVATPAAVVPPAGRSPVTRLLGYRWRRQPQLRIVGAAPPPGPAVPNVSAGSRARLAGFRTSRAARLAGPVPALSAVARRFRPAGPRRPGVAGRVPGQVVPVATPLSATPRRRIGPGQRRAAPAARPQALPVPPAGRRGPRMAAKPLARSRGTATPPPPRVPASTGRGSARGRITGWLRRATRVLRVFPGLAPSVTPQPGAVTVANRPVFPLTLAQASPTLTLSDSSVSGLTLSDSAPTVILTNAEAGGLTVRDFS